jgi:hypothetical protein
MLIKISTISANKGLHRAKHNMTTACIQGKVEKV